MSETKHKNLSQREKELFTFIMKLSNFDLGEVAKHIVNSTFEIQTSRRLGKVYRSMELLKMYRRRT